MTILAVLIGGFAVTPGYGQAESTTTRVSEPISLSIGNPCEEGGGGEGIELTG